MSFITKTLNWITTVFAPMEWANSTTIQVLVKAGSIYETRDTNGLSHFLEHMFFKWGVRYPTPRAVAETLDSFWADYNAFTGNEYAGYYIKCAPKYFNQALDVLSDMLTNAAFPLDEIETEKWVVLQEIAMYEDNPQQLAWTKQNERYNGDNPYGRPIIWPASNVQWFTQENLKEHHRALYTKDNLVIIVAGNIANQAESEEQIAELFWSLPDAKTTPDPIYPDHKPSERSNKYIKETQQNHLIISAPWFSNHSEERFAAKILAKVLGGGMSSRLFQRIREQRWLCYYIWGAHSPADGDGDFYIYAGMDKNNWDEGLGAIHTELEKIASGDVTEEEYVKALGNIRWSTQMGIETSDQMADFLWYQQLFKGKVRSLDEVLVDYESVTLDQVNALWKKLSQESLWTYWME